jgi:hypothetical protein
MKKELNTLLLLVLTLASSHNFAQIGKMIGLWEVEQVQVGKASMTPVAKWFRINADSTYQAGNGWLQSASGTWQFDRENNLYTALDTLDVADKFGGFTVSFDGTKMLWEREEEGSPVKVILRPVEKLPMSPADYLEGIWDLVEITDDEQSIIDDFDQENRHKLQIRWDRIYIHISPEGERLTGYWHIHGHKSEVTLLPHQESAAPESWRVEVNEKELLMKGISDSNRTVQRKYVRRNTF